MNKRKIKMNAVLLLITIILLIVLVICIVDIIKSLKSAEQTEVAIIDTIENYNYSLNENDPKYVKELFSELKDILSSDKIDEKEYAKLEAQLFIADFYTLDSAINKNDVGGIQFVYTDYQDSFVKQSKETVYATVENNIYGKRKQELPIVKEVKINNIDTTSFETDNEDDKKAYEIELEISYEKDLEYPKTVTLILIHSNDKLEVAQMK